ncbi:MAG: hypothetical protein L0Z53_26290 [Acidobacteriales bacterium]|nr:hypothetical protein [Terriglobales bacterium]
MGRIIGVVIACVVAVTTPSQAQKNINEFALTKIDKLTLHGTEIGAVTYKGRKAVKLWETSRPSSGDYPSIASIDGANFRNGTIEAEVATELVPNASLTARGFVGLAFRVVPDASRFEYIYIRTLNGRAEEQLRRNHSTQYASHPDFPWHKLRKETPGVYESYVDLAAGEWTHLKIQVRGRDAFLYVNHAPQPCLVVHDLKLGEGAGGVGLWVGSETLGYFSNLKIASE